MNKNDKIFVAGAAGLVGSAICRELAKRGFDKVLTPTSAELDLTNQQATRKYFEKTKPDFCFIAAAKVGGIWANSHYPADFCYQNLMIAANVIDAAYKAGVRKLLYPGSSCIYPTTSAIPIKEESLLMGPFEKTNEGYAIAKTAGIKLCEHYRNQYGCDFITVIPTNIFGSYDNFDLTTAHMVPSLIHKFHLAKIKGEKTMTIWGTGKPQRELLYVDDLADACVFLMENYSNVEPVNIGTGVDHAVGDVARLIADIVGFKGDIGFDATKPDGVHRKVMDIARLKNLGWEPKISLEEGLKLSYEWFKENYSLMSVHPIYHQKPIFFKSEKIKNRLKRVLIRPELLNRDLNDPEVVTIHRQVIRSKPFLKELYEFHYSFFVEQDKALGSTPGLTLEIGSGGGFLKEKIPHVTTSETQPCEGVDRIEDASHLSFKDGELRAIFMTGVLHHVGRPREFFREASRCLRSGGILAIMEPHMSCFGQFFFQRLHHERNDMRTNLWEFPQLGPLSDANTALPYLIFDRDWETFKKEFPEFRLVKRQYHTFLLYGLSGGVSFRFCAPGWSFKPFLFLEKALSPFMKRYLATMQTIVLKKV